MKRGLAPKGRRAIPIPNACWEGPSGKLLPSGPAAESWQLYGQCGQSGERGLSHDRGTGGSHGGYPHSSPRGPGAGSQPGSGLMPNTDSRRAAHHSMASGQSGRAPRTSPRGPHTVAHLE